MLSGRVAGGRRLKTGNFGPGDVSDGQDSPGAAAGPSGLLAKRHQAEVQDEPDRHGEQGDGDNAVPSPCQRPRLHGEDRNHEIIAEAGVAEELAVFGIAAAYGAEEGERAEASTRKVTARFTGIWVVKWIRAGVGVCDLK